MMFPDNRQPASSTPANVPTLLPVTTASVAVNDDSPTHAKHADYNLHQLEVRSLDHYMEHEDEDERFHIR